MPDRLMLLDTASLYFRAFYGVPDTVRAPDGTPVNADGACSTCRQARGDVRADASGRCWDDDWRPQWRVNLIPSYKTHRVAEVVAAGPDVEVVPDPLEAQVPLIRAELGALGIPIVGAADHEADDVIGSLAAQSTMPVDVVTGDRDLFQLVDDDRGVRVVYTGRGMSNLERPDEAAIVGRYGVLPEQYADYAVLRGDSSDGLPASPASGRRRPPACSPRTAIWSASSRRRHPARG